MHALFRGLVLPFATFLDVGRSQLLRLSARNPKRFRSVLFGGIGASIGATAGWLMFIVAVAVASNWKVLIAPLLGALFGLFWQWIEHYVQAYRREMQQGVQKPEQSTQAGAASPDGGPSVRVGAFSILFLGIACEQVIGKFVEQLLIPILASIAVLFPVGVFWACMFSVRSSNGNLLFWPLRAFGCALICAVLFVVIPIIAGLPGSPQDFPGAFGWWFGISFGFLLLFPFGNEKTDSKEWEQLGYNKTPAVYTFPTIVIVVMAVILGISRFDEPVPDYTASTKGSGGPANFFETSLHGIATLTLSNAGIPGRFWAQAEEQNQGALQHNVTSWSTDWIGKPAARILGCPVTPSETPPPDLLGQPQSNTDNSLAGDGRRFQALCQQVRAGPLGPLFRSWFVLILFATGLGFGLRLAEKLPENYESSDTRANDATLLFVMVLAMLLMILLTRNSDLWRNEPN
jgi:hypothetical protein